MFQIRKDNHCVDGDRLIIEVALPLLDNRKQEELLEIVTIFFIDNIEALYNTHVKFIGRLTVAMAMSIGYLFSSICKSVSIFDPKENKSIEIINHDKMATKILKNL
jgi:hypothetical protein